MDALNISFGFLQVSRLTPLEYLSRCSRVYKKLLPKKVILGTWATVFLTEQTLKKKVVIFKKMTDLEKISVKIRENQVCVLTRAVRQLAKWKSTFCYPIKVTKGYSTTKRLGMYYSCVSRSSGRLHLCRWFTTFQFGVKTAVIRVSIFHNELSKMRDRATKNGWRRSSWRRRALAHSHIVKLIYGKT